MLAEGDEVTLLRGVELRRRKRAPVTAEVSSHASGVCQEGSSRWMTTLTPCMPCPLGKVMFPTMRLARVRVLVFPGDGGSSADSDGVEEAEASDVVVAQGKGLGCALVGVGTADDIDRVHDGPVHGLLDGGGGGPGKDVVVGLGPGEAEDTAEGSHELVLELKLLLGSGTGAAPVEDEDGVPDLPGGRDSVDTFEDSVLAAAGGRAGSVAEHEVDDGAVGVVEDGDLDVEVVCAQRVGGKDDAGAGGVDVVGAGVLGEGSSIEEVEVCARDGPDGCRSVDDSVGGGVADVGTEVSRVGEVSRTGGVPGDGDAFGTVIGLAGDPSGSTGMSCAGEKREEGEQKASSAGGGPGGDHGRVCCQELSISTTVETGDC